MTDVPRHFTSTIFLSREFSKGGRAVIHARFPESFPRAAPTWRGRAAGRPCQLLHLLCVFHRRNHGRNNRDDSIQRQTAPNLPSVISLRTHRHGAIYVV